MNDFEMYYNKIGANKFKVPLMQNPTAMYTKYFGEGSCDFVGRIDCKQYYKNQVGTDANFALFCNKFGIEFDNKYRLCQPSIEAEYLGTSKYNGPDIRCNDIDFLIAEDWMHKHFRDCKFSSVVSLDAAIANSVKTTSAGFPWFLEYKNKGEALENLRYVLDERWDDLKFDTCVPVIWRSTAKFERRPNVKLDGVVQKLRVFTASPFDHSILLARMNLDINEKFYASAGKTWSFVGQSTYFRGWDQLYNRLNKHPNAFELDESAYDASLSSQMLWGCFKFRWQCLRDEDKTQDNLRRMYNLYSDIIDSHILCGNGDLIQKHHGNPSGSANTVVDNTLVLFWIFAYAFIKLSKDKHNNGHYYGYDTFMENVEAALYGDDNTFTVSDQIISWFNAEAISKVWATLGIKTNSGTGSWAPSQLSNLTFLSQGFRKCEGIMCAVPDYDKALCSLLHANAKSNPLYSLLRAYAMRLQTWADPCLRQIVAKYINWLEIEFKDQLSGSFKGISAQAIRSVYKTDFEIKYLFIGSESSRKESIISRECDKIKIIRELMVKINKRKSYKDILQNDARRELRDLKNIVDNVESLAADSYGMVRDFTKGGFDEIKSIPSRLKRLVAAPSRQSHPVRIPPPTPRRGVGVKTKSNKQNVLSARQLFPDDEDHAGKQTLVGKTPDTFKSRTIDHYVPAKPAESHTTWAIETRLGDLKSDLLSKMPNHSGDGYADVYFVNALKRRLEDEFKLTTPNDLISVNYKGHPNGAVTAFDLAHAMAMGTVYDDRDGSARKFDVTPGVPAYTEHNTVIDRIKGNPGHMVESEFHDSGHVQDYLRSKYGRVPAPRLIGVEPNPGPKAKGKKMVRKSNKKGKRARPQRAVMNVGAPAPVAMSYSHIQGHKNKKTVIRHCEQVAEINGVTATYPSTFTQANGWYSFHLNPGLVATFPWLSLVSQQYEAYAFKKINFVFMPYSPSSTKGYVAMNFDYDPQDESSAELPSKQAFCDYDGAVQSNAWEATAFNVRCPNKEGPVLRENRSGPVSGQYDLHNYDHGIFNMVVGGQADTSALGTLYVEYVVEFHRPRVSSLSTSTGFAHLAATAGISATVVMGTSLVTDTDNIPISVANNVITFDRVGRFMLSFYGTGTVLVGKSSVATAIANCSVVGNCDSIANAGATVVALAAVVIVDVTAIGATCTFAPYTSGTTFTGSSLYVAQIPSNLAAPKPSLAYESEINELRDQFGIMMEKMRELDANNKYVEAYYSASSSSASAQRTPAISSWDTVSRGSRK